MSLTPYYARLNVARANDALERLDRGALLAGQPASVHSLTYQHEVLKSLLRAVTSDLDAALSPELEAAGP